jgi:hypothetical protein
MDGKNQATSSTISPSRSNGWVFVVTYSASIGTNHFDIAAAFPHSVIRKASDVDIRKFVASGEFKKHVAAKKTVIIVASLTGNDVIKGLQEALRPVRCVSWWIHYGLAEALTTINSGQGNSFASKWHKLLKTLQHKVVPPILAEYWLPRINDFDILRFEPEPFDVLLQRIVSTPVPPQTNVSIVILDFLQSSVRFSNPLVNIDLMMQLFVRTDCKVIYWEGSPEFVKKFWAQLNQYISQELPLFGKTYIIVCRKPSHFDSYWEMRRSYKRLDTPLGKGGFLITSPYNNDDSDTKKLQFFKNLARNLDVLCMLNDTSAPNLSSEPNLSSAPTHSNMEEVD